MDERFPEHAKLSAVKDRSQAIGVFLDFHLPRLGGGMAIYERIERACECSGCHRDEPLRTHSYEELAPGLPVMVEEWAPTHRTIDSLLAEAFGIDNEALQREKDQMLTDMREANRGT